jgi:hypothetical protein
MKTNSSLLVLVLLPMFCEPVFAAEPGDLPDATHPGWLNSDVTQATIGQTICVPGYSRSIRPLPAYTSGLKAKQLRDLGASDQNPRDYEEDHLIPLSLGGHPRDPRNLWPEHWDGPAGAHVKDRLEFKLYKMVCAGQVPLATAQQAIAANWIDAYRQFCPTDAACLGFQGIEP